MEDFVELNDQLFRRESARIVAALTRLFGPHNLALAEDVAQDAFCRALDVWRVRGVPQNPSAWLMMTAKNRAIDFVRRERTARTFAPEVGRLLESEWTTAPVMEEAFTAHAIEDGELRMMFACCHPQLAEEAQVALILNVLCGFSAPEIASAYLAGRAAVEKRITRGKKVLAASTRLFELGDAAFISRLAAVRRALYLLFNEGYHGASAESAVRAELCREAIRLVRLLLNYPAAATPETTALASLMHLHGARLPARTDAAGDLSPWRDQDRSRWDSRLLDEGLMLFERSAAGNTLSAYHIEAAIAATHGCSTTVEDTDWAAVVGLYDRLLEIAPSPMAALNRAIAVAERDGPAAGIEAVKSIRDVSRLAGYPFLPATLGELERRRGHHDAASEQFSRALLLARSPEERRFLEKRMRESAE